MTLNSNGDTTLRRLQVSGTDSFHFILRLVCAAAISVTGVALVLMGHSLATCVGIVLLGLTYAHAVELQHQCLHHSAFAFVRPHRYVGILLGLPMLVSYSHYRIQHLHHHRYLGTTRDSEFFGFEVTRELTWRRLVSGLFDYRRLVTVARDVVQSIRGTWRYDGGQISPRVHREVIEEYRLIGLVVIAALGLGLAGFGADIALLWVAPLAIAIPTHLLIELPEHLLCDRETIDVLRNTRSIKGSRLSAWFTNGNNFHIEHHMNMLVPLQCLRDQHDEVATRAKYVERSYLAFYRQTLREVRWRGARGAVLERGRGDA